MIACFWHVELPLYDYIIYTILIHEYNMYIRDAHVYFKVALDGSSIRGQVCVGRFVYYSKAAASTAPNPIRISGQ